MAYSTRPIGSSSKGIPRGAPPTALSKKLKRVAAIPIQDSHEDCFVIPSAYGRCWGTLMGKPLPMELRRRVVDFVEEGHTHRGEPSARHWFERDGERGAFSRFDQVRERYGHLEADDRVA